MNLGNSVGGITLMLLAVVWLAVFVPQWANRAQEPAGSNARSRNRSQEKGTSLSSLELQLLRLTRTRAQMVSVSISGAFVWIGLFFLTSGTPVGFILWPVGVVVLAATLLAIAAHRRLLVLAGSSVSRRQERLSASSQASRMSLRATPLPRRGWDPNPMPKPLQERQVGEIVMRGAKVVPFVESQGLVPPEHTPVAETTSAPETASIQIDEILRRRRAN